MLRVVCGQCGKKLEIPDAWAHNVVKCPQCREPIDLEERDSAECAVKLGQFLNENLGGDEGPGGKPGLPNRPAVPKGPPSPAEVVWKHVRRFVERHTLVVSCGGVAFLLILLDTFLFHTGTVTVGALAGGFAAVAAWKSEMRSRLPTAAQQAEIEYKVAIGLIALLGLRLAWFAWSEITTILATENLASIAPVFGLLPKWGAILAVVIVAAIPMGAALGSLPLVQRFSIYHVLSAGLVLLSAGYGVADVVAQQTVGVGVGQFVRKQVDSEQGTKMAWAGKPAPAAPSENNNAGPEAGSGRPEGGSGENVTTVEAIGQPGGAPPVGAEPAVIAWTATVDPAPVAPRSVGSRLPAFHLGSQPWNPVTPAVPSPWLAVGDNRGEQSVRQLWDLSRNSRLGELAGQIEFVEPVALSADEPLIAGFIPSGMLVEVWSLAEGQMISRVPCPDIASGARPFIAFVAPEVLLLVRGRGPDPNAPPMCQIWNFVRGEMLAEFPALGATADQKTQWAMSPGRKYLAAVDKSQLHVYDLTENQLVGKSGIPPAPATAGLDCAGIAFSPDGHQVAAIFRGEKKSRLLVWDMTDGKVIADGEFNIDLARGSPPDGRPIQPLGGGAGWVAFERVMIPPISGKQVRAWTLGPATATGPGTPRVAKVLDSSRLLVVAEDSLRIVKLPAAKQRGPNELVTLAQLLNGGPAATERKSTPNQPPMPGAGQSADGGVPDRVSRSYARDAYIEFLSSDDDRFNEQVRWAPWVKRPVMGVRWGLGVIPTNVPVNFTEKQQIEPVTGAVGPKLVAALDERLDDGVFGTWPPGEDSRLTRVGWLGVGTRSELTSSAKRQDLDVIAVVDVKWQKGGQRQTTVRIADMVNGIVVYTSSPLKTVAPTPGSTGKGDSIEKWLSDLMRQIDQKMTLQPFPELTAEDAKQAAKRLVSVKRHDLAADLVELRAYQARHLIDAATAAGYYEQVLGGGMGEAFANGDADERRRILEEALPTD